MDITLTANKFIFWKRKKLWTIIRERVEVTMELKAVKYLLCPDKRVGLANNLKVVRKM